VIEIISINELTERSVNASCLLDSRVPGTGLSGAGVGRDERPTKALAAVAVPAQGLTYAFAVAANGAGAARQKFQKTQQHAMWAFRGLKPWRYPA